MECPSCHACGANEVTDTRLTSAGTAIRRRRGCLACGTRFTTYEVAASGPPARAPVIAATLRAIALELEAGVLIPHPQERTETDG